VVLEQVQVPPQPSEPQVVPEQLGVHVAATHWPLALQTGALAGQVQVPPQPSEPQVVPEQLGVQAATH
jgi:hypothetical protein